MTPSEIDELSHFPYLLALKIVVVADDDYKNRGRAIGGFTEGKNEFKVFWLIVL